MKNSKITKILIFTLTVALLVCLAFAFSVSAEETTDPELAIAGKNIVYGDTLTIQYAVSTSKISSAAELVVANSTATLGSTKYSKTETTDKITGTEDTYYVFEVTGIPASDVCEDIIVHVEDGDKVGPELKYSLGEYFYERLYADDVINATEGKALYQKDLYLNYLAYAASAQNLFKNFENGENVTLVTNRYYVYVQDGTINGVDDSELFDPAVSVSAALAYTGTAPEGKKFDNWTVITYTAEGTSTATAENGDTVTLTGHTVIAPNYKNDADVSTLNPGEKFDDGRVVNATTGYITNSSGTNTRIQYYKTNSGTVGLQSGDAIEIVNDPANSGNKVLKFTDGSTKDYTSVHITAYPDRAEYSGDNTSNKGVKTTFETLLYIEEYPDLSFVDSQTVAQPMFTRDGRSEALSFNITYSTEDKQFYFALPTTGSGAATLTQTFRKSTYFNANEWVAIRFEWYQYDLRAEEQAIIKLYINNVHAADITPPASMLTAKGTSGELLYATHDVDHMMWKGLSSSKAVMYFDNLSMYDAYIDQTIVETPAE